MADDGAHFDRLSARKDAPYPPLYLLGLVDLSNFAPILLGRHVKMRFYIRQPIENT